MRVTGPVLKVRPLPKCPGFMEAVLQEAEHKIVFTRDDDQVLVGQHRVGKPDEQPIFRRLAGHDVAAQPLDA
jgi:hypothetical protein